MTTQLIQIHVGIILPTGMKGFKLEKVVIANRSLSCIEEFSCSDNTSKNNRFLPLFAYSSLLVCEVTFNSKQLQLYLIWSRSPNSHCYDEQSFHLLSDQLSRILF